jgi:hypothetical protein
MFIPPPPGYSPPLVIVASLDSGGIGSMLPEFFEAMGRHIRATDPWLAVGRALVDCALAAEAQGLRPTYTPPNT